MVLSPSNGTLFFIFFIKKPNTKSSWDDSTNQPNSRMVNCTQHAGVFNTLVGSTFTIRLHFGFLQKNYCASWLPRNTYGDKIECFNFRMHQYQASGVRLGSPQQVSSCSTDIQSPLVHGSTNCQQDEAGSGESNCFIQFLTCFHIWVRVLKLRAQTDWFETWSLETPATCEAKVINKHIRSCSALPMRVHPKKSLSISCFLTWNRY